MDKQIDKALTTLLGTLAKMKGIKRARATSEAMSELIVKLKGTRAQLKKANKDKELDVDEVKTSCVSVLSCLKVLMYQTHWSKKQGHSFDWA